MMTRVTAPGLPPFPKLYVDPERRRAQVAARHATWRSDEWAARGTTLLSLAIRVALCWWLAGAWERLPPPLVVGIVLAILTPFVSGCLRATLQPFLARRVFPTRTTLWVTADAIAFQSALYAAPVVAWRRWNGLPVGVRFIAQRSPRAAEYAESLPYKKRRAKKHLAEAAELVLVLATQAHELTAAIGAAPGTCRAIPIGDLRQDDASRFTVVYAAALAMTAAETPQSQRRPRRGVDIEGALR